MAVAQMLYATEQIRTFAGFVTGDGKSVKLPWDDAWRWSS